ncbi:preprotein translocase subunit SecA [Candidatus Aerophobetes bacterium]|nr:preprotein translocase subunit SecA [Candidatus Aerophobetes bacterium]
MIGKLLGKVFGTSQQRSIKKLLPLVNRINSLEKKISRLSDKALQAKTDEFRGRLKKEETLDDILPEAFAVVREVAKRTIGLRHHDVQLIGGIVLHRGAIAEMANGEGKTLVATLVAYLNGLEGKGVHIVTVNDYLARRDREWMGPVYEFLGLSVGVIQNGMSPPERKKAYACDIVHGTNNEFGFDYLRDNMASSLEERVQRGFHYTIVDEIDNILIDEARTPLIISGPAEESTELYYTIDKLVRRLKKAKKVRDEETGEEKEIGDYTIDEKDHTVALTEPEGIRKVENLLGIDNLYKDDDKSAERRWELVRHINQAIRAHELYEKDKDYLVKDGEVVIIDEFTGRLMPGRRWSDGLHQAVEAKEGVSIRNENQTLATITLQNYFRMYEKLSGMTGTAATEAEEFMKIYGLEVVVIPTNVPCKREELEDKIYQTEKAKFKAVVEKIDELYRKECPVLVGTRSVEKSEKLSRTLKERGIPHTVLNAKYHEREAQIVAQAGQKRAVTIATNMAGRGTDIKLGEGVEELGGLFVIGTERHESRRIDNQLRGRAGRQGDPGTAHFYVSLEDELMRIFGSERIAAVMGRLKIPEDQPIEHPWITRALERAQQRVERRNFDIRKQLLEYDDVMNQQREVIYRERNKIMEKKNLKDELWEMVKDTVDSIVSFYTDEKIRPEEWDLLNLTKKIRNTFSLDIYAEDLKGIYDREGIKEKVDDVVKQAYNRREQEIGEDLMRELERMILLHTFDSRWKDHLYAMDALKEGIGLRGYGQRDPLIEYKREAYDMFEDLTQRIKEEVSELIFKVRITKEPSLKRTSPQPVLVGAGKGNFSAERGEGPGKKVKVKVGRNNPCPCGSGKKYKFCCGR